MEIISQQRASSEVLVFLIAFQGTQNINTWPHNPETMGDVISHVSLDEFLEEISNTVLLIGGDFIASGVVIREGVSLADNCHISQFLLARSQGNSR